MREFFSQAQLHEYLEDIVRGYGRKYAEALWRRVTNERELAVGPEDMVAMGVDVLHAKTIHMQAYGHQTADMAAYQDAALRNAMTSHEATVPPELSHFATCLASAVLDEAGFLTLPENSMWLGQPSQGGSIMQRECYRPMFDKIVAGVAAGDKSGWIISGTPGIGKSTMALFVMVELAKQKKCFVFEYQDEALGTQRILYGPEATMRIGDAKAFKDALSAGSVWYLIDNGCPGTPYSGKRPVICFSSPRPKAFTQFLKGKAAARMYMPLWSRRELLKCRARLFASVPEAQVLQNYAACGGVARFVLAQPDEVPAVLRAARSADVEKMLQLVNTDALDADFSHRLLHFKVDANFNAVSLRLASPMVGRELMDLSKAVDKGRLGRFLVASAGDRSLGGLRGNMFKIWAHRAVMSGGTFETRLLRISPSTGSATVQQQEQQQQAEEFDDDEDEWDEDEGAGVSGMELDAMTTSMQHLAAAAEAGAPSPSGQSISFPADLRRVWYSKGTSLKEMDNFYAEPVALNNPAWDAIAVFDGCAIILQMTVQSRHGILMQPIVELLAQLPALQHPPKLVFAVPDMIFDKVAYQTWYTKKKVPAERLNAAVLRLQQFAMQINVSRASDSSG